jgi:hypothetical protein
MIFLETSFSMFFEMSPVKVDLGLNIDFRAVLDSSKLIVLFPLELLYLLQRFTYKTEFNKSNVLVIGSLHDFHQYFYFSSQD